MHLSPTTARLISLSSNQADKFSRRAEEPRQVTEGQSTSVRLLSCSVIAAVFHFLVAVTACVVRAQAAVQRVVRGVNERTRTSAQNQKSPVSARAVRCRLPEVDCVADCAEAIYESS